MAPITNYDNDLLQIAFWNVNGLTMDKFINIKSKIDHYHIIALLETWHKEKDNTLFKIRGFSHHSFIRTKIDSRAKRGSGGISIYINDYFTKSIEIITSAPYLYKLDDRVWLKLKSHHFGLRKDIYLGVWYIPPADSTRVQQAQEMLKAFEYEISTLQASGDVIIMGDLNARTGIRKDWIDLDSVPLPNMEGYKIDHNIEQRVSMDKIVNRYGISLLNLCIASGLKILNGRHGLDKGVGRFTCTNYKGSSVVDYVLATNQYFCNVHNFKVTGPLLYSDHSIISFGLTIQSPILRSYKNTSSNGNEKWKIKLSLSKLEAFKNAIASNNILETMKKVITMESLEMQGNTIVALIRSTALESGALYKAKTYQEGSKEPVNKWFDSECRHHKRRVKRSLKMYKKNYNSIAGLLYYEEKRKYKSLIRTKKRLFSQKLNEELRSMSKNNPTLFWKKISNYKQPRINIPDTISTEEWVMYFKGLHQSSESALQTNTYDFATHHPDLDDNITMEEVYYTMKNLKSGKAPGFDGVPLEVYQSLPRQSWYYIIEIWNNIFSSGDIPKDWCKGVIIPVFKSGDNTQVENYRGITLLPTITKILFSIMVQRINVWAESKHIIPTEQFGFRSGYRTTDAIFILYALIQRSLVEHRKLYCCFVDLKKAFDSINHSLLFAKLASLSMSSKLLRLITNMYAKAESCVLVNGEYTEFIKCNVGVRQGCPMSPILFILYLHDLMQELRDYGVCLHSHSVPGLMFADDIVLISHTPKELQLALNKLQSYCSKWKLAVNEKKTKIVIFSHSITRDCSFTLNGNILEQVEQYKYLGIILHYNGSFRKAVDTLLGSARKVLYLLRNKTKSLQISSPYLLCLLFEVLVEPVLLYGCEVWGVKQYIDLERFLLKFCKDMLCLPQNAPNLAGCMVRQELFHSGSSVIAEPLNTIEEYRMATLLPSWRMH